MKFPQSAVKLIRSPFGYQDHLKGILAILSGKIRGRYAELRDRIDVGKCDPLVVARVVRVDPIHQEPGLIVSLTESLNRVLARDSPDTQKAHPRNQIHEGNSIPSVQGQIPYLLLFDHAFYRGFLGLDQLHSTLDRDLLGYVTDRQNGRDSFLLAHGQFDALQAPGLE